MAQSPPHRLRNEPAQDFQPWSRERLQELWAKIHGRQRLRKQAAFERQLAFAPVEFLTWRDKVLDELVTKLAKNNDTVGLSGRLGTYLAGARGLEKDAARRLTPWTLRRLRMWTTGRLPDLLRRRRDSAYRLHRDTYERLSGRFPDARTEFARRGIKARPADWRPILRNAWMSLGRRTQLTDGQVDEIAFTAGGRVRQTGRIRAPQAMALEMLAKLTGHDAADLKREFRRVRLEPPAL